jgi:hypothetical protein
VGPLKLVRRPVGNNHYVLSWQPVTPPWEFTEADVFREAATLDHLADLTRELGSAWDAAVKKFGGSA